MFSDASLRTSGPAKCCGVAPYLWAPSVRRLSATKWPRDSVTPLVWPWGD